MTITPLTGQLRTGDSQPFVRHVSGTGLFDTTVTWSVNGIQGGDATHGLITSGAYTAPAAVPTPNTVTVTATSRQDPTKSASASVVIYSVSIAPASPNLYFGHSQQFTASVVGLSNPVVQWSLESAVEGTITPDGLYTAPEPLFGSAEAHITATVSGGGTPAITLATLSLGPAILTSITPNGASAGEQVTIHGQDLYGVRKVFFPGPNGITIDASFEGVDSTQVNAFVPFGTVSGPVYMQLSLAMDSQLETSTSTPFTRLPNLHIHAPSKDLSSGETMQFASSLLGASTPNQINWTATSGAINGSGLYQAPIVTSESSDRVTGCLQDTRSCDTVLLRVLPLRITPDAPIVSMGNSVPLDAEQGGAPQTAQWSVLAGGGTVTHAGLYTASNSASKAGPVPISATVGSTRQDTSVSVTGAFPGLVNRTFDYIDFHNDNNQTPEGSTTFAVTASGNRAYAVDFGGPFSYRPMPTYAAIDTYDISDPSKPIWLGAVESTSPFPMRVFTYGNNLFELDSGSFRAPQSHISIYNLQGSLPVLSQVVKIPSLWSATVRDGLVYGIPNPTPWPPTSFPVEIYDLRNGTVVPNHYDFPTPADDQPLGLYGISGIANMVYVSWENPVNISDRLTIAAYDISTTPPTLVGRVLGDVAYNVAVINSDLLFADFAVFDISGPTPVRLAAEFPMINVQSVQGNQVLALGWFGNFLAIDVSNPSNPVLTANVPDLPAANIFNNPTAAWAGNYLLATDAAGGIASYDVSNKGGPAAIGGMGLFWTTFDQSLQQQTLYVVGESPSGEGGIAAVDISGPIPIFLGMLNYPDNAGFSVQVSGTNAFLGLADSLKTIDVSNPSAPVEMASVPIPANALALSGSTLFVGTGDNRLVVLDVSNPTAPRQIASTGIPGPPNTIRCSGTKLFIADGSFGLLVYDVADPTRPVLLSQFTANNPVWDVAVVGTAALLAADASGLIALDLTNPARLRELSETVMPPLNPFPPLNSVMTINPALSVSIQNGLAYVGTTLGTVLAFDVDHPANPRLLALNSVGGTIPAINALRNNLYIAADGVEVQLDNAAPLNSIQLFYPPAIFADLFPFTDSAAFSGGDGSRKFQGPWKQRRAMNAQLTEKQSSTPSVSDCREGGRYAQAFSTAETFAQKLSFLNACRHVRSPKLPLRF